MTRHHCISYDPVTAGYYTTYGALFANGSILLPMQRAWQRRHLWRLCCGQAPLQSLGLRRRTPGLLLAKVMNATKTSEREDANNFWTVTITFADAKTNHVTIVRSVL